MALGSITTTKGWAELLTELKDEFKKWGDKEVRYPTKKDALITGEVALLVKAKKGEWKDVRCGAFGSKSNGPECNLCAVKEAVRSMRLAEQRGIGAVLMDLGQFLALPSAEPRSDAHFVLGVRPSDSSDVVRRAYRERLKQAHPDTGGDASEFMRVQEAGRELGVA